VLSKIDIRDFIEITRGLYAGDAANSARAEALLRLIAGSDQAGSATMPGEHVDPRTPRLR
jgi:hypothetical protein